MKKVTFVITLFLLSTLLVNKSYASTLFQDDFTDTDGTSLQSHNSTWAQALGGITIQSNHADSSGGTNAIYYVNDFFTQTNQCASADVTFPLPSFMAIFARRNEDRSAYYYYSINSDGSMGITSQNGLLTSSGATDISSGVHNMKICAIGTQITSYLDNSEVLNVTDSANTEGTTEVSTGNSGGVIFDNFLFTDGSDVPQQRQIVADPATQNVSVGTPFNVDVKVNSDSDNAFNAAQATVAVSSNLSITGIHNATSNACNLQYTKHPTPSDPSFAGAIFNGSSAGCTAYTMTLTPTSTGTGTITFTNGSIKAYADNSEILTGVQNGSFTIGDGPTPTPTSGVNQLTITSPLLTYLTDYTLTGGKDSAINHIFINGSDADASFPTDSTWSVPETLSLGDNNYTIYGTDGSGNQTATQTIDVNRHTLGDINGDGVVDLTDASLFAVDWNKTSNLTYILSDMNNDGSVDLTDLSILAKLEL